MAKVALVTVHGMGETQRGYAKPMLTALQRRMGDSFPRVDTRAAYYQHILQDNEQEVWKRINTASKVHYDDLRKFLLFGFGDAAGLENRKEDDCSTYELAQAEIARALLSACEQNGSATPLVLLAHSLGCQVLSSYLYDAQKAMKRLPVRAGIWRDIDQASLGFAGRVLNEAEKRFISGGTCTGLITTGCNIPIFVAAHQGMTIIPIDRPTPFFRWLNLYDPDDVLGWPLQPLSPGYSSLVQDRAVNSGQGAVNWILKSWNPASHNSYWTDDEVIDPLADMLSLQLFA